MFQGIKRIVLVLVMFIIVFSGEAVAIRNGIQAEPGEFDAVGMVDVYQGIANCTGTLIEGNLVLTAAHCVALCSEEYYNDASSFEKEKCFKKEENFTLCNVTPKNGSSNLGDYTFIGKVEPNPLYEMANSFDLALIKLDKNVSETLQITPISVSPPYALENAGNLKYIGYGSIGENCEIKDNRNKYWAESSSDIQSGTIISGTNITIQMHQKGFCRGDSGGPLIDNNMTIVGILRKGPDLEFTISPDSIEFMTKITEPDYNWIQNATINITNLPKPVEKQIGTPSFFARALSWICGLII